MLWKVLQNHSKGPGSWWWSTFLLKSWTYNLKLPNQKRLKDSPLCEIFQDSFFRSFFWNFQGNCFFLCGMWQFKSFKAFIANELVFSFQTSRWSVVVLKSSFDEERTIDDVPWGIFGKIFKSEQNSWKTPLLNIDFSEDFTYLLKSPILRNAFSMAASVL